MIPGFCSRREELRQALKLGYWPNACPTQTVQHVDGCRACSEFLRVSQVLEEAKSQSIVAAGQNAPGIVSPGLLWWKAQLRRRDEALQRMDRPLLGAQIFALILNVLILIGVITWQAHKGAEWLVALPQSGALHLEALWSSAAHKPEWNMGLWVPCAVILVLMSGVVVYLASEKS